MAAGCREVGFEVFYVNWLDFDGQQFSRMFFSNNNEFVTPLSLNSFELIFVYKVRLPVSFFSRFFSFPVFFFAIYGAHRQPYNQ